MIDWQAIVREHGPPAYKTALQEAMLDAVRLARQRRIESWGGLLRRLAACRALDLLRKRKPRRLEVEPHAPLLAQPDAVAVGNELATRLRLSLFELAPREAEVFALRYFGELTNAEIAATLDLQTGAVAVLLHKARTRLAALLDIGEEQP